MDSDRNYNHPGFRSRGATLLEYAIVTAILVAVFVVVADRLFTAVSYRGNESANTVRNAVPCSPALQNSAGSNDPNPCL